jgi:hypothetical protein
MALKTRVKAGRLVVDEPTDLPEGTKVELFPVDPKKPAFMPSIRHEC